MSPCGVDIDVWFFPTVLGFGLNPTPAYGRWVKSHVVLSHCLGVPPLNSKEDIWSSQMAYRLWILIKSAEFPTSRVDIAEISSNSRGIVKFSNRQPSLDSDI